MTTRLQLARCRKLRTHINTFSTGGVALNAVTLIKQSTDQYHPETECFHNSQAQLFLHYFSQSLVVNPCHEITLGPWYHRRSPSLEANVVSKRRSILGRSRQLSRIIMEHAKLQTSKERIDGLMLMQNHSME